MSASTAYAVQDTFRFGFMPTISFYNLNDPTGRTKPGQNITLLSGLIFVDAGRDARFLVNGSFDKFSVAASTMDIGEDVTRLSASASYQTMFRLSRDFKPWLGFGVGDATESYKNRYLLTGGGFSTPVSPSERSVNNVFGLVNVSTEWELNRQWNFGFHFQYELPFGEGASVYKAGVYFSY